MDIGPVDIVIPTINGKKRYNCEEVTLPVENPAEAERIAYENIKLAGIPARKVFFDSAYPLSYSRWKLYQLPETEWFINLDDDVHLREGWFKQLTSRIDDNTIAVEGIIADAIKNKGTYVPKKNAWILPRGKRGFVWDTLLKTSVFKKWKPVRWVEELEELQIIDFLKGTNGYHEKIQGDWLRVIVDGAHSMNFERSALAGGHGYRENYGARSFVMFAKLGAVVPLSMYRNDFRTVRQNLLSMKGILQRKNPRWSINDKMRSEGRSALGEK